MGCDTQQIREAPEIVCTGLKFAYPSGSVVFDGADLRVGRCGFHSIFGKSGSGKSTLANILTRKLQADFDKFILPERVLCCASWERLPPWLPVRDHLKDVFGSEAESWAAEFLPVFALDNRVLGKFPHQLSTGQAQRINLIRYIMSKFDVLILDEALHNVDEPTRCDIILFLKQKFADRKILLYISHDMADVIRYSDMIILLKQNSQAGHFTNIQGLNEFSATSDKPHEIENIRSMMIT